MVLMDQCIAQEFDFVLLGFHETEIYVAKGYSNGIVYRTEVTEVISIDKI